MNSYIYQKPKGLRYSLGRILGDGILIVEEDKHKQQVHLPCGNLSLILFMVLSAENNGNIHSFATSCFVFLRPPPEPCLWRSANSRTN